MEVANNGIITDIDTCTVCKWSPLLYDCLPNSKQSFAVKWVPKDIPESFPSDISPGLRL